jgi:ketosteroid isomerase-like protein
MSRENVEIVTRIVASFNAGDLVAASELFHADAEWRDLSHAPDTPEDLVGIEEILAAADQWAQAFDHFGAEVYEYIDAHPWVAAFARDEFPSQLLDPQVEYVNPVGAVEEGTRRGVPAFRGAVEKVSEGWATWQMEPEQLTAIGCQVAVVVRYRARGRTSGVELEGRESALLTLRNGKVTRYAWFHGPGDALSAVTTF